MFNLRPLAADVLGVDDVTARLTAVLEQLLRERKADPDRCCGSGCLHCPTARRRAYGRPRPSR